MTGGTGNPRTGVIVGVDVGGTFTDVVIFDPGEASITTVKVSSTPRSPAEAVLEGLRRGLDGGGLTGAAVEGFLHGTTVTTNTLIERRGARCALVLTRGLRGVAQVQSQLTIGPPRSYRRHRPAELVEPAHLFEVTERVDKDGKVVVALAEDEVARIAEALRRERIEAVAVSLLFSFANTEHELRVRGILNDLVPECRVVCSSDILPRIREWPRTSTAILSAYLDPCLVSYIEELANRLRAVQVTTEKTYVMASNGGVMPFSAIGFGGRSVHTLLSGPAAAVQAAKRLAESVGVRDLVTMDLGGTSCDIAFVKGAQAIEISSGTICGYEVDAPMLDIVTIGAGGGTIARVTDGGALQVGPMSAGARPGPAAYGAGGTEATITDADLVLGYLNPDYFLGGELSLDLARARAAIEARVAGPLGLGIEEAALAMVQINDAHMADTIRVVAAKSAIVLAECQLLACGGAGPVHAAAVAEELGIREILVPTSPGVFAALGLLCTDIVQDYVQTAITRLDEDNRAAIVEHLERLSDKALGEFAAQGFAEAELEHHYALDLRYPGQGFELRIPTPPIDAPRFAEEMERAFHARHLEVYGHNLPDEPVEVVSFCLRALVRRPQYEPAAWRGARGEGAHREVRGLVFPAGAVQATVLRRSELAADALVAGPAVVEQSDSTTVIPPGWSASLDRIGTLWIRRQ